jgi:hypothetical protein
MHFPTPRIAFILATEIVREKLSELGIAVITFALIIGIASTIISQKVQMLKEQSAKTLSLSSEQFQEKILLLSSDAEMQKEVIYQLSASKNNEGNEVSPEIMTIAYYLMYALFYSMLSLFITWFIAIIAWVFFTRRFLARTEMVVATVFRLPSLLWKFLLLKSWMFLWVPFIGCLIFPYYYPRFFLAPALLLDRHDRGVFASLKESMKRVHGHYFEMCLHLLFVLAILCMIFGVSVFTISIVSLFSTKIASLLFFCVLFITLAFSAAYKVALMGEGE